MFMIQLQIHFIPSKVLILPNPFSIKVQKKSTCIYSHRYNCQSNISHLSKETNHFQLNQNYNAFKTHKRNQKKINCNIFPEENKQNRALK